MQNLTDLDFSPVLNLPDAIVKDDVYNVNLTKISIETKTLELDSLIIHIEKFINELLILASFSKSLLNYQKLLIG